MAASSISAYQWLPHLSQPTSGNLSLSAAISAYQWLYWLYLSLSVAALVSQSQYQSISGWLIYLSAYQWLPPFTLGGTVGCCPIRGRGYIMGRMLWLWHFMCDVRPTDSPPFCIVTFYPRLSPLPLIYLKESSSSFHSAD